MNVAVFHGSPRKGNTYYATNIFMNELSKNGDVQYTEFFLPDALPEFCTGCQICLGNPHDKCPHAKYVTPILNAIINADAMIFTTPHFGACSMSGSLKNLLDHIDTLIGECGGAISSGQAQRIAIARAIYKNSPVIVFDEPTANLDIESVRQFQSAVRQLSTDKIYVIVTHNESTIAICDKTYALDEINFKTRN